MVHVHRSGGSPVLRALLLLLAAAVLPACEGPRDDVDVAVHNTGAEPVRVRVEAEQSSSRDDDDEVLVAAGSSAHFNYDRVERLKVAVWRTSDGMNIFLDTWDEKDIRREDDFISVTVTP